MLIIDVCPNARRADPGLLDSVIAYSNRKGFVVGFSFIEFRFAEKAPALALESKSGYSVFQSSFSRTKSKRLKHGLGDPALLYPLPTVLSTRS